MYRAHRFCSDLAESCCCPERPEVKTKSQSPQLVLPFSQIVMISLTFTGFSALHHAASYGTLQIVQMLFGRVRNPDLPNAYGTAPLSLACKFSSPDVGKLQLLEALISQGCCTRKVFASPFQFHLLCKTERKQEKKCTKKFWLKLFSEIFPRSKG